jgi:starch-binding outer membrane protein, SusD/RagB family
MAEFPADNVCLAGRTSDPLYEALTYKRTAELRNITYLWYVSYKIINGANALIETLEEGVSSQSDHMKGENYFLRAVAHFNLANLYSKPYVLGRDNPGIVLRTSTDTKITQRSTVGKVYDQIVDDLKEAIRLMGNQPRKDNSGYVTKAAAQGLLSRVYLYMGDKDQEVIDLVNDMLAGASPTSKLEPTATFPNYFANALTSKETLWAVAHTYRESRGGSSIGSMYLTDQAGWGEIYSSDPLNDLFERNSNDVRFGFIRPKYLSATQYMVRWAKPSEDDFYENEIRDVTWDVLLSKYYFTEGANRIYVETETVNGYPQNYIMYNGVKQRARVTLKMEDRYGWPKYFVTKFSYQDGDPMLSSPVMIRWAEVILNRAEAYARSNQPGKALDDVNVIRQRAGLSGDQLFRTDNMMGYTDVLDIVLDERRLELAFEGHRMFDVYRNKKNMDRRYSGVQPYEVVNYNDNKIQYLIPQDEINTSGISQNPIQ